MDKSGDGLISHEEFVQFTYLIPAETIKVQFKNWARTGIDIGESVIINDEKAKGTSAFVTLIAGGVAGAISRTFTAPMDRLKVLLQA